MKKILTIKQVEKGYKETERGKRLDVLQASFVVVCSKLHCTDPRLQSYIILKDNSIKECILKTARVNGGHCGRFVP